MVQTTTLAETSSDADAFTTGNLTQTDGLTWSRYSTSASASAVFSTGDHITGFEPR